MSNHTMLCSAIEAALDSYVRQDQQALERCGALQDKVLAINFMLPGLMFYFLPHASGIQVLSHYEGPVDTRLTGSPFGFARLALGNREDALFAGVVQVEGDTETGQKFQALLADVDWDWEEQLSRLTGDTAAHQIGNLIRRTQRLISDSGQTLEQDVAEYLHEEARLLPTHDEINIFLAEVDRVRAASDRLSARVQRLCEMGDAAE